MATSVEESAPDSSEELLVRCFANKYQTLMNDHFYSSLTSAEFEDHHYLVKVTVLNELYLKLTKSEQEMQIVDSASQKVSTEIDKVFVHLKRHFENAKERERVEKLKNSAVKKATSIYETEMTNFICGNISLQETDLNRHHEVAQSKAIAGAEKLVGKNIVGQVDDKIQSIISSLKIAHLEKLEIDQASLQNPAIGIDLGTTRCCVMIYVNGKVEIVANRAQGNTTTTPSCVCYRSNGTITYGDVAKDEAYRYPDTTIYDAKRILGRPWNDEKLQNDRKRWPFEILNELGNPKIKTFGTTRYPHEISAKLLARLRVMAEKYLKLPNGTIRKAVITVPAYFTDPQRRATREAAMCAGLQVLNILNEPTAAAIAYNWQRRDKTKRIVLIYDLGGGTFDVSIAEIAEDNINILGVDGDTHLGGHDFDQKLMDFCIAEYYQQERFNLDEGLNSYFKGTRDKTKVALARLREQCEKVKEKLSTADMCVIDVPFIYDNRSLTVSVTKREFNKMVEPLISKTLDVVQRAIKNAKDKGLKSKDDIDEIILVGGSTRIPLVIDMVTEFFGKTPCQNINPDEAVAFGAAVDAALRNKSLDAKLLSVYDVTPMSLGIEVHGQNLSTIIPKNTTLPCERTEEFVTSKDNQTSILITVYQGENPKSIDNQWLGQFTLDGLPRKLAGEEAANVTMSICEMGIVTVKAVSQTIGIKHEIKVSIERLGMDENTIKRLISENETESSESDANEWEHL